MADAIVWRTFDFEVDAIVVVVVVVVVAVVVGGGWKIVCQPVCGDRA